MRLRSCLQNKCFSALVFLLFDLDHKKHQTYIKADAAPSPSNPAVLCSLIPSLLKTSPGSTPSRLWKLWWSDMLSGSREDARTRGHASVLLVGRTLQEDVGQNQR